MSNKYAIFGFLLLGIIFLSGCSRSLDESAKASSEKPTIEKIEVINFHATQRCAACTALGKYSEATVYEYFQPELRDGIIEFRAVNVDLPENKELAKKYQAVGSSLFINTIYDGEDHIEEDARVWRLLSSEEQFKSYLKNKLEAMLNK
ncbi:hypothetical protein CVU83_02725 [Candidatus Falkowbacteria bacterium HGW-Falkowbacteria-2]|uniref:Thioredoxin domain-containing protein n=1 Tax=Candidatus Falkowbacteria bacterium HGW-Falkowbacteria-2 TaxID=2013769 RepID=A0A2N2DYY3_9BACT|nr:MAG: hypothetical protein CVU83_02725 [Candidatus Falkowbacteria bacterium HGW-Falkowbacteria-2]